MEITLLVTFLAICFIFIIFGLLQQDPKGLLFVIAGSLGFLILGINMWGGGVSQYYILNETLTTVTTEDSWTNFFGAMITLVGVGLMLLVVSEIYSKD